MDEFCVSGYSQIYIQYMCDSDEIKHKQQVKGLYVTMTAIISCFLFLYCVYYLRIISEIEVKSYDIKKTTVDDFSVRIEFTEKMWEKWLKYEFRRTNPSFKKYFIDQLEK